MAIVRAESIDQLAACVECICDCDGFIWLGDPPSEPGITLVLEARGVELEYPFTLTELCQYMTGFDELMLMGFSIDQLVDDIKLYEGFTLVIVVDFDGDQAVMGPGVNRRHLPDGEIVQTIDDYPYEEAAPDDMTFSAWLNEHFYPMCRGFKVSCSDIEDDQLDQMTLGELRRRHRGEG